MCVAAPDGAEASSTSAQIRSFVNSSRPAQLGYKLGDSEKVIDLRHHGVTPAFITGLRSHGYTRLSAEQLVNARDHGVTAAFADGFRRLGYSPTNLSLDELIRMRDQGDSF